MSAEPENRRRREARALLLPIIAALMIMPPVVFVFDREAHWFGMPVIVVYLFALWGLVIIGTSVLSRRLGPTEPRDRAADGTGDPGP